MNLLRLTSPTRLTQFFVIRAVQGQDSPVYYPLRSSILPKRGIGSATFTRASEATFVDWEGVTKTALLDEPRFSGARRVRNLGVGSGGSGLSLDWYKSDPSIDLSNPVILSPGDNIYDFVGNSATLPLSARRIDAFVELKAQTGTTGKIRLVRQSGDWLSVETAITFTGETQWCSVSATTLADTVGLRFVIQSDSGTGPTLIEVGRIVIVDSTGQASNDRPEFVSFKELEAPYHGANVDGVAYYNYELNHAGPQSILSWDYPEGQLNNINGFRVYDGETALLDIAKTEMSLRLSRLNLTDGVHTLSVTSYYGESESAAISTESFTYAADYQFSDSGLYVSVDDGDSAVEYDITNVSNDQGTVYIEADLDDWSAGWLVDGFLLASGTYTVEAQGAVGVEGSNLIADGSFASGIVGWSASGANATVTWDDGDLNLIVDALVQNNGAVYSFTTEAGVKYRFTIAVSSVEEGVTFAFRFGNGSVADAGFFTTDTYSSAGDYTAEFTAETAETYLYIRVQNQGSVAVNDVSVYKIASATGPSVAPSGWQKIAVRYGDEKIRVAVNGVLGEEKAFSGDLGLTEFAIGSGINGKLRELKLWHQPLNDEELTRITS